MRPSSLLKDGTLTFLGNGFSAALSFLVMVLASRSFSPDTFGLLSLAIAALLLTADLSDMGLNAGLLRFASQYVREGRPEKAEDVLAFTLRSRLAIAAGLTGIGLFLAGPIANGIFREAQLAPLLRLACAGIIPYVFLGWATAALQAHGRFRAAVGLSLANGLAKAGCLMVLLLSHRLSPASLIGCFIVGPLVGSCLAVVLLPRRHVRLKGGAVERGLATFSGWAALSSLMVIILTKIHLAMAGSVLGAEAAGIFSAASQLVTVYILLAGALATVLTPRLAGISSSESLAFLRSTPRLHMYLLGAGVVTALGGSLLLPLLFGSRYQASLPIFQLLTVAEVFFSLQIIPLSVLSGLSRPQAFAAITCAQVALTVPCNYFLMRTYGLAGIGYGQIILAALSLAASWTLLLSFLRTPQPKTT